MADAQARHEPGQRNFRRIRHAAEHRLAEEGPAKLHAIESADQLPLVPAFNRMGMADRVEAERRPLDDLVDPGFVPVGAGQQHLVKCAVAGDREASRSHALGQRAGQMESFQRNDRPVARLDPEDIAGVAAVGHGKDAGGIAPEQHPGIETFAHAGSSSQQVAHLLLRAAQAHALVGFHQRTLDQDRMFHHRIENGVVADRWDRSARARAASGSLSRRPSRGEIPARSVKALQFFAAWRGFQIFDDGHVGALIIQDFQRLARRPAHRIMVDGCLHAGSVHLPFQRCHREAAA